MKQLVVQQSTEGSVRYCFRLLFYVLFISFVPGFLSAQQVTYGADDCQDQWFIGFGTGPRIYFADHARQLKLSDRISGGADVYAGKWFSPFVGARIGGSLQTLKGATQNKAHIKVPSGYTREDAPYYIPKHWLYRQQFDTYHFYGDLLFNMLNIFDGADQDRFWTLSPFVGLGYMRTRYPAFSQQACGKEVSVNIGMLNLLRVGRSVDLTLDIRGAMVRDDFKGESGGRPLDGILSVNMGVAFRFGGNCKPKTMYKATPVYESVPPAVETMIERVTEWKDVATDVLILFQINQSTLLNDARVQLGFLAGLMRKYPESHYTITGYADKGTGNPDLNYRLSKARAERVKDCLIDEFGISPLRLEISAAGGIENRYYDDPSMSRSVIIRPDKY